MIRFYSKMEGEHNEGDFQVSKFNAAALQCQRIHLEQARINLFNLNPLAKDQHSGRYNYELIISSLNNLYAEVYSKLTEPERTKCNELKGKIRDSLKEKPVFKHKPSVSTHDSGSTLHYPNVWVAIEEAIFKYNLHIRDLLDKHGLNTPNMESEGGFD